MRPLLVLFVLAACGGSDTPATTPAPGTTEPATPVAEAPAPTEAAPEGTVTCDDFADHMMESVEKTAAESDVLTPAQALEFGTAMVEGLRSGCKANDRLAEFQPQIQCYMEGSDDVAWQACRSAEGGEEFNAYVTGLLAASIRLEAGVPE